VLRDSTQLHAGFSFLFLDFGTTYSVLREYQLYRAMQVAEILSVDESQKMRRPPDEAVYYLAEVHQGASYDVLIEGNRKDMGSHLGILFAEGAASVGDLEATGRYRVHQRGLGLRPVTGDAIFARTPEQVARRYAVLGEPVPVKLVFRAIPGRTVDRQPLPQPEPVANESFVLPEGRDYDLTLKTGLYHIDIRSSPNGVQFSWDGSASCDPPIPEGREWRHFQTICDVSRSMTIRSWNYTSFGMGPSEDVSIYAERIPQARPRTGRGGQ